MPRIFRSQDSAQSWESGRFGPSAGRIENTSLASTATESFASGLICGPMGNHANTHTTIGCRKPMSKYSTREEMMICRTASAVTFSRLLGCGALLSSIRSSGCSRPCAAGHTFLRGTEFNHPIVQKNLRELRALSIVRFYFDDNYFLLPDEISPRLMEALQ